MKPAMNVKAVIFDLDGTLLDTIQDIADSMNMTLLHFGFPVHPRDRYLEFVGEGIEALVQKALPESSRDGETIVRSIQFMKSEYSERWSHTSKPYPGISDLLDALTAMEIKLSILSNKVDAFTKLMSRALLPRWNFIEVRGLTAECPRKPDPCGALMCAEGMKIDPGSCIFIGDSGIDMETGTRAGMVPVGASWGYQNREMLLSEGARTVLNHPMELISFIGK